VELSERKARLLGLGMDNEDGEVRLTHGENFVLIGGSEETHEVMQEKCIKFNEKLNDRGKQLEELKREEFVQIAQECQMNVALPRRRKAKS
jgi:hypothetical protein